MSELRTIRLDLIDPHPDNPRLELDEHTVRAIEHELRENGGKWNEGSWPVLRPKGDRFETVEGHHRLEAGRRAGLEEVVCFVREMDDDEALDRLLTGNEQAPLHPIEKGHHVRTYLRRRAELGENRGRGSGGAGVKGYAVRYGLSETTVRQWAGAAAMDENIATSSDISPDRRKEVWLSLYELASTPQWLRQPLAIVAAGETWQRDKAAKVAGLVKELAPPPGWADVRAVAYAVVTGSLKPRDVARFALVAADHKGSLDEDLADAFEAELPRARPATLDAVRKVADPFLKAQHKRNEDEAQRDSFRTMIPLSRWDSLDDDTKRMLCHPTGAWGKIPPLIEQTGTAIEWAENSLNPITGCLHDCSYCVSGETLIQLADGRALAIAALRVGDRIIGTRSENGYRRLVETEVLVHWKTEKPAVEITLADGRRIISSGDHRFLTHRGKWKHALHHQVRWDALGKINHNTPNLTTNDSLLGFGPAKATPAETDLYRKGYLSGMIRGDGSRHGSLFRLALADGEALIRAQRYLAAFGVDARAFEFSAAAGERRAMGGIRTSDGASMARIGDLIAWRDVAEYRRGFLAGLFDAEGSNTNKNAISCLRVHNSDPELIGWFKDGLEEIGLKWAMDVPKIGPNKVVQTIRILGGLPAHLRFFQSVDPAIRRKVRLDGAAIKNDQDLRVVSVRPLGETVEMYDITTGTEDFIANGVVAHNCYARDLAFSAKMAKYYRFGFAPVFHPRRLLSPVDQQPKPGWEKDVRRKNIFVGSMADVFGRWVPAEWIEAIFAMCRRAPQWNYLFLTKFPQRLAEFDLPANGWYGTTVDLQVRVRNAERAFAKIKARTPGAVTWLSVEPMLTPLKFERLDLFDWVVIGGASPSSSAGDSVETPEWRPPFAWIMNLVEQCRAAGCKVYMKDNLLGSRLLEAPAGLPVTQDAQEPPEVFDYLGRAKTADEAPELASDGDGGAEEGDGPDGLTAGQRAARAVLDGGTREAAAARGANWKTVLQAVQVQRADAGMFAKVVDGHISPSAALAALSRKREATPVGG